MSIQSDGRRTAAQKYFCKNGRHSWHSAAYASRKLAVVRIFSSHLVYRANYRVHQNNKII